MSPISIPPATNAFDVYDKIKAEVLAAMHKHQLKPIILLAAGPATKILAHELSQTGIQCLDIGQGIRVIAHSEDRSDRI
jgi:beta-lactamase superfamily II metal-dependent hydrolase